MNRVKEAMLLYAVTDRAWTGKQSLFQQVEAALKGGVTCVQLREKDLPQEQFLAEALEIKELCKSYQVPFIINDNIQVAKDCGADGVHVGQRDTEVTQARKQLGENKIIGVSVQTVEQAVLAEKNGADYLGVGAVFNTSTKQDAQLVSRHTLQEICSAVSIPVCAIGGISKSNILELAGTGIDGAALVSAIFASGQIETECKELRSLAMQITKGS